jgi:hypothetical protein
VDRIPVGVGEIFSTRPDRPWGPPSLLYNWYRFFSGGKAAEAWRWPPPPPSSAEVKERVDLYLLPLWAFVACSRVIFTSPLPLPYISQYYGKAQNNSEERKVWVTPNYMFGSQDSSVSIATNDWIDNPRFTEGQRYFLLSKMSKPNRSHAHYYSIKSMGVFSTTVQRSDVKLATLPRSSEVKIEWVYTTVLLLWHHDPNRDTILPLSSTSFTNHTTIWCNKIKSHQLNYSFM